jgi:hypothetical protein
MATLFNQLSASLSGGGFNLAFGAQLGQFTGIASQAASLAGNPAGMGDFASRLAGLSIPSLPNGEQVAARLGGAQSAIPSIADRAAPGALRELARFGELVATRLTPLIESGVAVAREIEGLAGAQFRCPPVPGAPSVAPEPPPGPAPAGPAPAGPAPPAAAPGAARLALAGERAVEISSLLGTLPNPLTPGAVLDLLVGMASGKGRANTFPIVIPIFEDLVQPLGVLGQWSLATPAQIGEKLAETLALLRDRLRDASTIRLDAALAAPVALRTQLRPADLAAFATAYLAAANTLADALADRDVTAAVARAGELNAAVAAFETVRAAMAPGFTAAVPAAAARIRAAPAEMLDSLLHLAIQIEPINPSNFLPSRAAGPPDAEVAQALQDLFAPVTNFLEDVAEKLDLSAATTGVGDVAAECRAIADSINETLVSVAQETRAAFADVEATVRSLPIDDLAGEVRAGIGEAGDALQGAVRSAFAPFRDALTAAVGGISDAVDAVNPAAIREALVEAMGQITGVLRDEQVQAAVAEIRTALDAAAATASSLSFTPVADEVVAVIEQMTTGLRALSSVELNDALKGMLSSALSVLPPDLRPATQPLIEGFGVVIEQGPVPLLEAVRGKPQELLDLIRGFDPAAIAGETLGPPFRQAVSTLEEFRPSALLAPLAQTLDRERTRLKAETAPSRALAPITEAFDRLLAEFDRLSPDALLAPLEEQLEQAIREVVEASPVDEVFEQINGVFATIGSLLETVEQVRTALQDVSSALNSLADPDEALDSWRDAILNKIDAVPNAAALDALLDDIGAAIDAARLSDLLARFDAAAAPLKTDLDGLDAEARLAAMVTAQQRLRPLVRALPEGTDRNTIELALARFDPLNPSHTGSLRAASDLGRAVREARAALVALTPDFERLLHGPDAALSVLHGEAASASLLRAAVAREAEAALGPVRFVFSRLSVAAVPAGAMAAALDDLHQRVTGAAANILTGPDSLQSISQTVQGVVDTLRNIDFAFLREALEGVFRAVRGEIEAANPGPLLMALDREFGETIDLLDLDLLLPAAEIEALDASVAALVETLRGLDPEVLVREAIGPVFETEVLPLIEALDMTPVFDALLEALRRLEEELATELGRINTAYQALLAARPAGTGGGASASIG